MYGQREPDYSSITGLLHHMNTDELKKLLNDEENLDRLIRDLPQVRNVDTEKEMVITSNKSLAEFNLSKEPQLRQAKQRLVETYEKAVDVFNRAEINKQRLEELSRQTSLDTTLAILQTAAAQSEEESENTAEKFLEGGLDVEQFLDEFQAKRKIAHMRRIKSEKMNELISNPTSNAGPWPQNIYNVPSRNMSSSLYNPRM